MTLGLVLAFVFALGWVPLYLFRAETLSDALPFYRRAEQRWARVAAVVMGVHVSAACALVSVAPAVPLWRASIGLGLYALALGFWLWARVMIGPLRLTRLPDEPPRNLRQDGAFGIVRNPLYLSMLMAAAAPALVAGHAVLVLTYAGCVLALAVRAVQEERRLHAQLGAQYDAYARQVKRLVPFVW